MRVRQSRSPSRPPRPWRFRLFGINFEVDLRRRPFEPLPPPKPDAAVEAERDRLAPIDPRD